MTPSAKGTPKPNGHAKNGKGDALATPPALAVRQAGIAAGRQKTAKTSDFAVISCDIVNRAVEVGDPAQGRKANHTIHAHAYAVQWGGEIEAIGASTTELEQQASCIREHIAQLQREQNATPDWRVENDLTQPAVPIWKWRLPHIGGLVVSMAGLGAAFWAGWTTALTNLEGSGLPVFIENPVAAYAIATIAPMTSLAVKSFSSLFSTQRGKRYFRLAMIGSTVPVALFWMAGAASKYNGLDTGFDFEEQTSIFSDGFVFSQLLLEVLAGAVFALNTERIFDVYTPKRESPEERKEWREKRIEERKVQLGVLTDNIAAKRGRLRELEEGAALQGAVADLYFDHRRNGIDEFS